MDEPVLFATNIAVNTGIATAVRGSDVGVSLMPTTVVNTAPPPPPPPKKAAPAQKVGGDVLSSRVTRQIQPSYPQMARTARVQGDVVVEVEVDEEGDVVSARATSGPALLRQAAVDAVKQWKYSPTFLNGEPISVTSTVIVKFTLGG
jgi:protein TonB